MAEQERTGREATEEELYRLLVENVRDCAIFVVGPDGRVRSWNPGAERLLGYHADEIVGRPVAVFFTPEDVEAGVPERELRQALEEGRGEDDRWHVRKDGSRFWAGGMMTPLWDEGGTLRGFAKIMRDRTELKRAEDARQASEGRQAAVLETALDAIVTIGHDGRVVEFNPAAERLFGYRRAAVLGRDIGELIVPPRLREAHRRGMARYLATGEGPVLGRRIEMPALKADGTEFPVELAVTRVPTAGPPVFTAYLRDIGERTRTEARRTARLAVTQVLAQAATVGEGATGVLRAVCESLGWDVGFFWALDRDADALRCLESWHRPGVRVAEFEAASRGRTFGRGEGLPGRVWSTGRPTWLRDVTGETNFPRAASAAREGLHGALGCPVSLGAETLGVIEFFSGEVREPDADLLEMMATVAGQLGQFLERGRAEEALRQSEERFRGLMEQAPFSVQVLAPDGRTLRVNRAWEELWGVTPDQIADYNVLEDPQLEAKGVLPHLRRAFAGEAVEIPAIRYDPNETIPDRTRYQDPVRWVSAVAYPLKDAAGRVREVVLVHDDITARRRAEEALGQSEEKFRLMADTIPQLAWMAGPDGDIFWYNRRWYEYTGTTPEQMEGWGWQRVHDPDVLPRVLERWKASLVSGEPFDMVFPLKGADGRFRPFLTRVNPLRDETGRVLYWFGTNTDIGEQKRAEDASRFLADASATLAAVVDYESTLGKVARLAVPFFADWCAVDMAEADGSLRRLAMVHVDPSKVGLANELHRRYTPGPDDPYGPSHVLRTGRPEMAEITNAMLTAPAWDEDHLRLLRELGLRSYICVPLAVRGKALGVITFITSESGRRYGPADLTVAEDLAHRAAIAVENAQLYQELRDADRRKDEFLATLAHELRNPLAPIHNSLQILKVPGVDAAIAGRSREMMERQVQHLVRLVDDLLDVSRVMRGKIELRPERVELAAVVARAVETARPVIDAQRHELTIAVTDEPLTLDADSVRLAQVVGNLLTNAAKYTDPGGRITVAAGREGDDAVLRVRDTGIGIAPDMLPRVFDLFVQVDPATTRSQGGLGIGLTLVKNLVGMHHGSVEARSEGLGKGSEFVVSLPLSIRGGEEQTGPENGDHRRATPSPARRLLVVDDNVDAAESLAVLLRLQGHEVRVAHDGPAALKAAAGYRPAVVFLDIGMPGMDGYEVARRLRRQPDLGGVVLIALTGWGQPEDRRRSREAGFDHHLVKPVDPTAFEKLLADPKAAG